MRPIKHIHGDKPSHWVGDGFYVKTLINHLENNLDFDYSHTDPFLLLDYGVPTRFEPNPSYQTLPHGVGLHPHKGFEVVTIAYSGEISHADSVGGRSEIAAGDVQWMTAGRGIMHEEFHSLAFGQNGGIFSMVQMWINLPSAYKLTEPKYQTLRREKLPIINLISENNNDEGEHIAIGKVAVIAGEYYGHQGLADTFIPINLWDIELHTSGDTILEVPNSHNVFILVQQGVALVNQVAVVAGQLIQFSAPPQKAEATKTAQTDTDFSMDVDTIKLTLTTENANDGAKLLLLSGAPIGEPIAAYGPFVLNTQEELKQTFRDYQTGSFV